MKIATMFLKKIATGWVTAVLLATPTALEEHRKTLHDGKDFQFKQSAIKEKGVQACKTSKA